jgi:hypothetical protein
MTLRIMAFSIKGLYVTLSMNDISQWALRYLA